MQQYSTVVIGGGAAGISAAISKARSGSSVLICEKLPQIGKKILASGNGRCNLLNENLDESHYNLESRDLVRSIFERFGKREISDFFARLGLEMYSPDGRVFPRTNQAASVLKLLDMELKRLNVTIKSKFNCSELSFGKGHILVSSEAGEQIVCQKLIITGGGTTYPAFGSDGSTHELARKLGHTIIAPVPSAVPLVAKDILCHSLQGQRISARVRSVIEGNLGDEEPGDLLFTKYGLSGTCILDISDTISVAMGRYNKKDVFVLIDMVPFMDRDRLNNELVRRQKLGYLPEEMLAGILPNKLATALHELFVIGDIDDAVTSLKARHFKIIGTRGWNEAEFTNGGIDVKEINPMTLESELRHDVYFAGEVIDVNGRRGGYNLAWAWASGYVAGETK